MSFLAPWALAIGAIAAASVVLLHLLAQRRPAAYDLPTTRFIPDRRTLVRRVASRPSDLLLLALRVLLLLAVAAAFARPVLTPQHGSRARIVLLDRSTSAPSVESVDRVHALPRDGVSTRLIAFDSAATSHADALHVLDSLARARPARVTGSLSAALVAARREAARFAGDAESVELVLVSPVMASEVDAALDSVRATWPGGITIARTAVRPESAVPWTLARAVSPDDVLGPAVVGVPIAATPTAVRLRRAPLDAADSAFARNGGTVVQWDTVNSIPLDANALALGDDVVVSSFGRLPMTTAGRTVARWADGAPAAVEIALGQGCVRQVAVAMPSTGDLPLRPSFRRVARGLLAPCSHPAATVPADSATIARLSGTGPAARGAALALAEQRPTPLVPWLLALALLCALIEVVVRARPVPEPA